MKLLDKTYKDGYKVLIVDDKDGFNSIPFAKHEAKVTMLKVILDILMVEK